MSTSTGGTLILNPGTGCTTVPATVPAIAPNIINAQTPWQISLPYPAQWITVPNMDGYAVCGGNLTGNYDIPTTKKINKDGCKCKKCKEFFPYAEANQPDGTLVCYGCRVRW
jgi:hypothetical protein